MVKVLQRCVGLVDIATTMMTTVKPLRAPGMVRSVATG
jgi:hypothetical protein